MWGYYNKFDSTKSLGVSYWCVKISQYGYMGHGLKLITFYVQKLIAALAMCHNLLLVRDKPLGAPASVKLVYWTLGNTFNWNSNENITFFIQANEFKICLWNGGHFVFNVLMLTLTLTFSVLAHHVEILQQQHTRPEWHSYGVKEESIMCILWWNLTFKLLERVEF